MRKPAATTQGCAHFERVKTQKLITKLDYEYEIRILHILYDDLCNTLGLEYIVN